MVERASGVKASIGFSSETGPRERNEDFAGAVFGSELPEPRQDVVAAIADGIGGAKGGRVAAETAVRGFLDGFCDLPETMEVRRAAAKVVNSLNGWIHSLGRQDPEAGGHGMHLHRAGAARPHRACAACRRHARLPAERRTPDLPHHRPCAGRQRGQFRHSLPRAGRRGQRCGWTTPASRSRSTIGFFCAATACTASCRPRPSPTSCASALHPTTPRARWWPPRCDRAAPTTARLWCSTSSRCRRSARPTSAPL